MKWQASVQLPGVSLVLVSPPGAQLPHTVCPAPLLQSKTKTRNSKSFTENQINCECRHLPLLSVKTQNVQHDPVLLRHPLGASEAFGCHTHGLQALSRFSTDQKLHPSSCSSPEGILWAPPCSRKVSGKASIRKWGQEGLQVSNYSLHRRGKYMNIGETKVEYNNPRSKCQKSKQGSDDFISAFVGNLAT